MFSCEFSGCFFKSVDSQIDGLIWEWTSLEILWTLWGPKQARLRSFPSAQQDLNLITPFRYIALLRTSLRWGTQTCTWKKTWKLGVGGGVWYQGALRNIVHFVLSIIPLWWCGCGQSVSLTVFSRPIVTVCEVLEGENQYRYFHF